MFRIGFIIIALGASPPAFAQDSLPIVPTAVSPAQLATAIASPSQQAGAATLEAARSAAFAHTQSLRLTGRLLITFGMLTYAGSIPASITGFLTGVSFDYQYRSPEEEARINHERTTLIGVGAGLTVLSAALVCGGIGVMARADQIAREKKLIEPQPVDRSALRRQRVAGITLTVLGAAATSIGIGFYANSRAWYDAIAGGLALSGSVVTTIGLGLWGSAAAREKTAQLRLGLNGLVGTF